jgi:hypothetical protein
MRQIAMDLSEVDGQQPQDIYEMTRETYGSDKSPVDIQRNKKLLKRD